MSLQNWLGGIRLTRTSVSFAKVNFNSALRNKNIELSLGFQQLRQYTSSDVFKYARLRPELRTSDDRFALTKNLVYFANARSYTVGRIETQREEISGSEAEQGESDIVSNDEYVPARFDEITAISPNTQKALKQEFRYKTMSKVQDAVLSRAPIDGDLFVKAKTGTGKTLAFLIPAIETMLRNSHPNNDGRM
ncbi:6866_t:CDS:2, partial [Acaulospora morrowiae]